MLTVTELTHPFSSLGIPPFRPVASHPDPQGTILPFQCVICKAFLSQSPAFPTHLKWNDTLAKLRTKNYFIRFKKTSVTFSFKMDTNCDLSDDIVHVIHHETQAPTPFWIFSLSKLFCILQLLWSQRVPPVSGWHAKGGNKTVVSDTIGMRHSSFWHIRKAPRVKYVSEETQWPDGHLKCSVLFTVHNSCFMLVR